MQPAERPPRTLRVTNSATLTEKEPPVPKRSSEPIKLAFQNESLSSPEPPEPPAQQREIPPVILEDVNCDIEDDDIGDDTHTAAKNINDSYINFPNDFSSI